MANKKATMTDLRLLIREFIKGTSKRKISEILNLSRTSIDVYLGRMEASGKSAEELLHSDDKTLSQVMVRDSGHRNTDSEKLDELTPLLEDYARQMQLRNMTYQLLFENYSQRVRHPYGYTQFKEKLQAYEKAHSYSFHNVYEPAGEMQVGLCWRQAVDYGSTHESRPRGLCPGMRASFLKPCLRHCHALHDDGELLRRFVALSDLFRWCTTGSEERQHAAVGKEV